jgi:hypothetical protein
MRKIKGLIHGPAGRGKTTLARTALGDNRLMPFLLLSFEGGVEDAIGSSCQWIEDMSDIGKVAPKDKLTVYEIKQWADFNTIYRRLDESQGIYNSLFIDSASELNLMALAEFSGSAQAFKNKFSDVKIPQIQDYGKVNTVMDLLFRSFRDLDMNVIFTAGSELDNNPSTGRNKYYPSLTGKMRAKVNHIFSLVGFFGLLANADGGEDRCLCFDSSDKYEAKVRDEHGNFPPILVNPTLPKILDLLNQGDK